MAQVSRPQPSGLERDSDRGDRQLDARRSAGRSSECAGARPPAPGRRPGSADPLVVVADADHRASPRVGGTTSGGPVPSRPAISAKIPTAAIPSASSRSIFSATSASALPPPSLVRIAASRPSCRHRRAAWAETSSLVLCPTGSGQSTSAARQTSSRARSGGDDRVDLVQVGRVLERRVAVLAADDRAVVELVRRDHGRQAAGQAAPVDEDVLVLALRLEVGDDADPRAAARAGARARGAPRPRRARRRAPRRPGGPRPAAGRGGAPPRRPARRPRQPGRTRSRGCASPNGDSCAAGPDMSIRPSWLRGR